MEPGLATLNGSDRPAPWSAVIAAALMHLPGMSWAMSPDDPTIEEILVTARRVRERALDLPLAIDVFTHDTLRTTGISTLGGIAALAPGFSFEQPWGASGGVATLRGQSQPTAHGDNVAVFVDGVYQANRSSIDLELLDIERIELIRGPQSTLFGHGAFAGALQIVSRAPTREQSSGFTLEGGSDGWFGAQAFASGPLSSEWLGRIAVSYRRAGGTLEDISSGRDLGGFSRTAVAVTVARSALDQDWTASLSLRHTSSKSGHPAVASLTGVDFNCGSRDPSSRLWSYYCGIAPTARRFDVSDDLPESTSDVSQAILRLAAPIGTLRFESDTSAYRGSARVIRDFDASASGQAFGVCVALQSCLGSSGRPALVDRFITVNEVLSQLPVAEEFLQEFRLRSDNRDAFNWLAGLVYFETRERALTGIGAERGTLAANEVLVAVLPGTPQLVGPVSRMNRALVDNPSTSQVDQARTNERRRSLAAYAALDWRPLDDLELRAEFRGTQERLGTDSVTANFLPSFGTAIPEQDFRDFTPRLSLDYAWNDALHTYVSAAKGSRSGGINPIPGLVPEEQSFAPEYNWTYETGVRLESAGLLRWLRATGYYIDWRDTQITGFSVTPGITNLVTLNTAGVITSGLEVSLGLQPVRWLRGEFDYSYINPAFRQGSDDPSAGSVCGLSPSNSTSTFCTVGPPRNPSPNSPALVPWLDGNAPSRVPQTSWHGALVFTPQPLDGGWRMTLRADLSHQDGMFDRGINAYEYGARTPLGAQLSATRGPWSIEVWGRNLSGELYIRSGSSRQAQFYPTSPRPLDHIYDSGRRIGITIHYTN